MTPLEELEGRQLTDGGRKAVPRVVLSPGRGQTVLDGNAQVARGAARQLERPTLPADSTSERNLG